MLFNKLEKEESMPRPLFIIGAISYITLLGLVSGATVFKEIDLGTWQKYSPSAGIICVAYHSSEYHTDIDCIKVDL